MKKAEISRVEGVAQRLGITLTEFIARAIADELTLQSEIDKGGKVLVQGSDGSVRQVLLR